MGDGFSAALHPTDVARAIREQLVEITRHYDATLEPQRNTSGLRLPTEGGVEEKLRYARPAIKHSPPPIDVAVLDARRATHEDLLHYSRVVYMACTDINGDLIVTPVDALDIHSLCGFLATWAERLAYQDSVEAAGCLRDMTEHAHRLRAVAYPQPREWIAIGSCPLEVIDDQAQRRTCGATVRAYAAAMNVDNLDGDDAVRFIACPGCGHEDTLSWWAARILPEAADVTTADEVITFVTWRTREPITHAQLRQWASRGVVERHGRDEKGRTLYSSREVLDVALARMGTAAGRPA